MLGTAGVIMSKETRENCCLLQAELVEHVRLGLDVILFLVCLVLMLLIVIVVLRRTWGRDYIPME